MVGCGPVGLLTATLLAQRGLRVLAVDRAPGPAGEPRAIASDDEVLRILLRVGGGPDLVAAMDALQRVVFLDASGARLTELNLGESALRLPRLAFFDQPALEAELLAAAVAAGVDVEWDTELVGLDQDSVAVTGRLRGPGGGRDVGVSWLLGCDGGRSTVRRAVGVDYVGSSGHRRWLVVDCDTDGPLEGLPHMRFHCDPAGPHLSLPRPGGHRFESALAVGESDADATSPARVRALLLLSIEGRLLDDGTVRVRRAAVYDYQVRRARRWRVGRVVLLGDAAHAMPPFAGQGLSAGLRDAEGLAWRLALLARGLAGERVLGDWERERRAHVAAMTRLSLTVGGIVESAAPGTVLARGAVMRTLDRAPGLRSWWRGGGLKPPARLPRRAVPPLLPGGHSAGEGLIVPRPRVRTVVGRLLDLDEVLGDDHCLIALGVDPALALAAVPEPSREALRALGLCVFQAVAPGSRPVLPRSGGVVGGTPIVEDLAGTLLGLLGRLRRRLVVRQAVGGSRVTGRGAGVVALVRPDRHLAGAVLAPDLPAAVLAYLAALKGAAGGQRGGGTATPGGAGRRG